MNSQQWKDVLDKLDEDIVNSAAERFSTADADDEPLQCSDGRAREYRNISRKSRRGGIFIGIGSVVVAAAVMVIVLVKNMPTQQVAVPLSDGAVLKSASAATAVTLEIEEAAELESSFTVKSDWDISAIPTDFSADMLSMFDEYFYGSWAGQDNIVNLCYSANSAFGDDYICTGIEQTNSGCYMGAQDGQYYDLWFVPAESMDTMYIYRNVTLNDGMIVHDEQGTISCEKTEKFEKFGSLTEYSTLGYFGRIKLADMLGMTYDALYKNVELDTFDGSDAGEAHWIREDGDYSSPWDKVVLKEQTDSSFVMSMAFTQSDDAVRTMYFDLYWYLSDNGTWSMQDVRKSKDVFAMTADDLRVTLTLSDLDIFEMYYAGTWTSDTEEFVLNYTQDIFDCTGTCGGFYADTDGWYMYKLMTSTALETTRDGLHQYIQVYYIPYSDPNTMYVYEPDIFGYIEHENYLAVYTHTDFSLGALDTLHMSWLGLQRWILNTRSTSDENSLSKVLYSFLDNGTEYWNVRNMTDDDIAGMEFSIQPLDDGTYHVSAVKCDRLNYVTLTLECTLKFADNEWSMTLDG